MSHPAFINLANRTIEKKGRRFAKRVFRAGDKQTVIKSSFSKKKKKKAHKEKNNKAILEKGKYVLNGSGIAHTDANAVGFQANFAYVKDAPALCIRATCIYPLDDPESNFRLIRTFTCLIFSSTGCFFSQFISKAFGCFSQSGASCVYRGLLDGSNALFKIARLFFHAVFLLRLKVIAQFEKLYARKFPQSQF